MENCIVFIVSSCTEKSISMKKGQLKCPVKCLMFSEKYWLIFINSYYNLTGHNEKKCVILKSTQVNNVSLCIFSNTQAKNSV